MINELDDVIERKPQLNLSNPNTSLPFNHLPICDSILDKTNLLKQLEQIKKLLLPMPAVNESRVQYFKAMIQANQYQINPHVIARQLMSEDK